MDSKLATAVLNHLNVSPAAPDLRLLEQLIRAYPRIVPWESASRIAKKGRLKQTPAIFNVTDCPRWPEEFWTDSIRLGNGGTCFESNYAFFALLQWLGYTGYLTINNMGGSIGCHTAIVVLLDGQKWLADAGYPIPVPLLISPNKATHRASQFLNYTVRPYGQAVYQIEREPHPKKLAFTLIDRPVADADYRAATIADYGDDGLFLDKIVINMIVDELPWRFNSGERPFHFESFKDGQRTDYVIEEREVETAVAHKFGLDLDTLKAAFGEIGG